MFKDPKTGILPLNKPIGKTSFNMVSCLRRLTHIQTIGHAGTLDPFATGVLILLIGKDYTRRSSEFLTQDKEYMATLSLGTTTDTFDREGTITHVSSLIPTSSEIEQTLLEFQGTIQQIPPMFSAKKVDGQKLYHLARKGITIERAPISVTVHIELIAYTYPLLEIRVQCTKGTYIRTLAYDIGNVLRCGAHLSALTRTRSGTFHLDACCEGSKLVDPTYPWQQYLIQ